MRTRSLILAAALAVAAGACSRTDSGDVVIDRPADVDVTTQKDTLHLPRVTTKTETIDAPVIGTKKDTIVVDKPVVGTEKKAVKVPVVKPER